MKVCVITTSLGKGGAERSSAILTQLLSQINFQVHIVVTKNIIDYEFFGTLLNLELEMGENPSNLKKVKILRAYFKKHKFDAIIDNRCRENFLKEYFLYHYIFQAKKMITIVHSYYLNNYFPRNKVLAKFVFNKNTALVAVSEEIKKAIEKRYGFKNVFKIHNALDFETISNQSNQEYNHFGFQYILWYGRVFERVKNLSLLLESYQKSSLAKSEVKLIIMGEGEDLENTIEKSNSLNLKDHVIYLPYLKNPYPYVKNALFTVLTSRYEGFPMVLMESLACNTPVVSVDCKSGPNEIIKHGYNGLLVENHNIKALSNAFDNFIEDKQLYEQCKLNTRDSIKYFALNQIGAEWAKLLKRRNGLIYKAT